MEPFPKGKNGEPLYSDISYIETYKVAFIKIE